MRGSRTAASGPPIPRLARGYFVEPTVFADVTDDMRIAREEIFGPVVSILRWSDENDLLARVNALDVGLTASIWTHDLDRAHRLASKVEAGYIWINGASTHHVGVPFGGYKQSGLGREESIEELLACTQIKNVNVTLRRNGNGDNSASTSRPMATAGTTTKEEVIMHRLVSVVIGALLGAIGTSAAAEEIAVGNYGVSANGMPFGVALRQGLLQGGRRSTSPASSRRRAAARRCATCWPAAACRTAR